MGADDEIIVGKWRCKNCRTVNSGNDYSCQSCGMVRPEDTEFFLDGEEEIVIDEDLIDDALSGPDWVCEYCRTSNKYNEKFCVQCGNPYDGVEKNQKVEELTSEEAHRENRNSQFENTIKKENYQNDKGRGKLIPLIIFWVIACIGIFAAVKYFTTPTKLQVTVNKHYWQRTIDVQNYKEVTHSDWNVPYHGRVISSHMDIYGYRKVLTGYKTSYRTERYQSGTRRVEAGTTNLGNGKFRRTYRDEPVYSTRQVPYKEPVYRNDPIYRRKYTYGLMEWVTRDHRVKEGYSMQPVNPEYEKETTSVRNSNPTEIYKLILKDNEKKKYTEEVRKYIWQKYKDGAKLKATKDKISGGITIQMIK
jgi:hypothetical protein